MTTTPIISRPAPSTRPANATFTIRPRRRIRTDMRSMMRFAIAMPIIALSFSFSLMIICAAITAIFN